MPDRGLARIEFKEPGDASKLEQLDFRLRDILVPWYQSFALAMGTRVVRCTDLNTVPVRRASSTHREFRAIDFGFQLGFGLEEHVAFARMVNNAFRMYASGPYPVAVVVASVAGKRKVGDA